VSDEEREYLNEMIRSLNNRLVDALRERDEARRLLKAVVNMMRENMVPDATHPKHLCDFIHRPDIAMCKVCDDWMDAMLLCYPNEYADMMLGDSDECQGKEDGK